MSRGEGKAKAKTIQIVNQFIDEHEKEIMEIWEKAQRGEKIEKISDTEGSDTIVTRMD